MKLFALVTLSRRVRNRDITRKLAPQTQFGGFKVLKIKVNVSDTGVGERADLLVELEDAHGKVFIWNVYERRCYYEEAISDSLIDLDSDFYQTWNITYGSELPPA